MEDVYSEAASRIAMRVEACHTMQELWHVRVDVFGVVSCELSQEEAAQRLTRLNRHFPKRAPRSSFGALLP